MAAALVDEYHGVLLRGVALKTGQHFQGLAQAARHQGPGGYVFDRKTRRGLREFDITYNWLRHISQPKCSSFVTEVLSQLEMAPVGTAKEEPWLRAGFSSPESTESCPPSDSSCTGDGAAPTQDLGAQNELYDIICCTMGTQTDNGFTVLPEAADLVHTAEMEALRVLISSVQHACDECDALLVVDESSRAPALDTFATDIAQEGTWQISYWTDDMDQHLQDVRDCISNLTQAVEDEYDNLYNDTGIFIDAQWFMRLDRWWPASTPRADPLQFEGLTDDGWLRVHSRFNPRQFLTPLANRRGKKVRFKAVKKQ